MNNVWLISIVTIIYTVIAINYYIQGSWPTGIIWTGYALANIGFILLDVLYLK